MSPWELHSWLELAIPFHLDMIVKYPSCFNSKTDCFDDLVVEGIEVLFPKNNRYTNPNSFSIFFLKDFLSDRLIQLVLKNGMSVET